MGSTSEFSPTKMLAYVPAAMVENPKHVLELQGLSVSVCCSRAQRKVTRERQRLSSTDSEAIPACSPLLPPRPAHGAPCTSHLEARGALWGFSGAGLVPGLQLASSHDTGPFKLPFASGCRWWLPSVSHAAKEPHEVRHLARLGSHRPSPLPAALS